MIPVLIVDPKEIAIQVVVLAGETSNEVPDTFFFPTHPRDQMRKAMKGWTL